MKTARRISLFVLSLVGGAALVSTHADAQTAAQRALLGGKKIDAPPAQLNLKTNVAMLSTDVGGGGTVNVGTNGSLAGIPILNGFHFKFGNGDHKFQRVGIRPTGDQTAYVVFRDHNGDDKYKAEASWITLNGGGVKGEVAAKIFTQKWVKLPTQKPANSRLVLSGFELRFPDKDDYDVRMIGIWLDEASNMARVTFINGGFAPALGSAGTPFAANREARIVNGLDLDNISPGLATDGKSWPFDNYWSVSLPEAAVRLQYAWIPNEAVSGETTLTGSQRAADSGVQFPARAGIQGFEFRFDSGPDHHLMELGIMPPLPGATTRNNVPATEFVEFQDKNRDDSIKWAVKTVTLK